MKPGGFSPHLCNSKSSNSGRVAAHFNELTLQIPTQHVTQSLLCHMYNPRHMWCLLPALLYLPKALLCLEKGKKKPHQTHTTALGLHVRHPGAWFFSILPSSKPSVYPYNTSQTQFVTWKEFRLYLGSTSFSLFAKVLSVFTFNVVG